MPLTETEVLPQDRGAARESLINDLTNIQPGEVKWAETDNLTSENPAAPPVETVAVDKEVDAGTEETPAAQEGEAAPESQAQPSDEEKLKADPEVQKRLSYLNDQESRVRQDLAKERYEIDSKWKEIQEKHNQLEEMKTFVQNGRRDPAGLLLALGFTKDDLAQVARDVFLNSTAAQKDPRYQQQAETAEMMRRLSVNTELARQKAEEAQTQMDQRWKQQEAARRTELYLDATQKAVNDTAPIIKRSMEHNPAKTRQELYNMAELIASSEGRIPEPTEVIKALENAFRKDIKDRGLDVDSLIKPASQKTVGQKTLTNNIGSSTKVTADPDDRKALLAEVRQRLEAGKLD